MNGIIQSFASIQSDASFIRNISNYIPFAFEDVIIGCGLAGYWNEPLNVSQVVISSGQLPTWFEINSIWHVVVMSHDGALVVH